MPNAAQTREVAKANALVSAWRKRYATTPSRNAVVLVLSVAELETRAGDFRGSHNWGQIQRRGLTIEEAALLKTGTMPKPRDAFEILSSDTHPTTTGPIITYAVWLWAFPDDVAGADKLLSVLLEERPSIKRAIDTMTYEALAGAMYESKYFEGSHPRNEVGGPAANVAAYAESMRKQGVDGLLFGWMPPLGSVPTPATKPPDNVVELAPASSEEPQITAIGVAENPPEADPFPAEPVTSPATPSAKAGTAIMAGSIAFVVAVVFITGLFHACAGVP